MAGREGERERGVAGGQEKERLSSEFPTDTRCLAPPSSGPLAAQQVKRPSLPPGHSPAASSAGVADLRAAEIPEKGADLSSPLTQLLTHPGQKLPAIQAPGNSKTGKKRPRLPYTSHNAGFSLRHTRNPINNSYECRKLRKVCGDLATSS